MKAKYKKSMFFFLTAAALISILYSFLKPINVPGIRISRSDWRQVIKEEGILTASRQWNLYAPENLLVDRILVKEGDFVTAGQTLVELDKTLLNKQVAANENTLKLQLLSLENELSSAVSQKDLNSDEMIAKTLEGYERQIETATANYNLAVKEYENARILYGDGFVSKSALDQAQLEVSIYSGQIKELKAKKELTRDQMGATKSHYETVERSLKEQINVIKQFLDSGDTDMQSAQISYLAEQASVKAPDDGVILSISVREGERADTQNPIISVYQPGSIQAEVYLLAEDAVSIDLRTDTEIILKGKEKERILASVISVSSKAEKKISTLGLEEYRVKVMLALEGSQALIIGQNADVEFVVNEKPNGIAVPKAAVFDYEDGLGVAIAEKGTVKLRKIEKDFETDTMVVVASGLEEGEMIVSSPTADGIKDGKRIKVQLE